MRGALGRRAEALSAWQSAWQAGSWPRAEVAYLIAQLHGRLGHGALALDWIDTALVHRLEDRPRMQTDSAFLVVRDDPRFRRQAGFLPEGLTRDAAWRYDIAHYVEEAQRLNIAVERPALSRAFLAAAAKLDRDVPNLSDTQIAFGLTGLARMLGDGHSYVVGRLVTVPVQFYQFSDGLHIINASGAAADLVGARVERIGNVSSDSAMGLLSANVPKDNEMTPIWLAIGLLASPAALHALGISNDSTRVTMRVVDRRGKTRTLALVPEASSFPQKLSPAAGSTSPPPLWLSRVSERHWLAPLPDMKAVYAQFNQVRDAPQQTIAQFDEKLRAALASSGATRLIVDVRLNNGGRRSLYTPLLLTMAEFKRASPANQVYVITGRGTFSATQVFIAQAEWMVDPVYVGEPSSSRPNFVGEDTGIILPYSRMRGSASSHYHQGSNSSQDERPFIAPHIPVALSAADYFANRDPVMSTLAELFRN
jgi:hypothetical protein